MHLFSSILFQKWITVCFLVSWCLHVLFYIYPFLQLYNNFHFLVSFFYLHCSSEEFRYTTICKHFIFWQQWDVYSEWYASTSTTPTIIHVSSFACFFLLYFMSFFGGIWFVCVRVSKFLGVGRFSPSPTFFPFMGSYQWEECYNRFLNSSETF